MEKKYTYCSKCLGVTQHKGKCENPKCKKTTYSNPSYIAKAQQQFLKG